MILLIDNYDSFTYNLFQYLSEFSSVVIKRNDSISLEDIKKLDPEAIVLSPGPKRPKDAGICLSVIKEFYKKIPILGVCLGHQCIGKYFGGIIDYADKVYHGKISSIIHNKKGVYKNIKNRINVNRYHSLVVSKDKFPDVLEITSETDTGEIMSIRHRKYPVIGLQFHPESIATEKGKILIKNFLKEVKNVSKVFE